MVTILGSSGFVGSNLKNKLVSVGINTYTPHRSEELSGKNLGHVIYCIGLTADFRTKPFETIEAHVCFLSEILQKCKFESFTYLSSTRIYIKSLNIEGKINEEDNIVLNPNDPEDIFGSSKIMGELLLLNSGKGNVKIVRLSNVFGSDLSSINFLNSIIRDAVIHKKVELFTTPDSSKDYISIEEVCEALLKIIFLNKSGIYNLCFGSNTSNQSILEVVSKITGAEIKYSPNAKRIIFQEISNNKLVQEIGFQPSKNVIDSLDYIIKLTKR